MVDIKNNVVLFTQKKNHKYIYNNIVRFRNINIIFLNYIASWFPEEKVNSKLLKTFFPLFTYQFLILFKILKSFIKLFKRFVSENKNII